MDSKVVPPQVTGSSQLSRVIHEHTAVTPPPCRAGSAVLEQTARMDADAERAGGQPEEGEEGVMYDDESDSDEEVFVDPNDENIVLRKVAEYGSDEMDADEDSDDEAGAGGKVRAHASSQPRRGGRGYGAGRGGADQPRRRPAARATAHRSPSCRPRRRTWRRRRMWWTSPSGAWRGTRTRCTPSRSAPPTARASRRGAATTPRGSGTGEKAPGARASGSPR